jgi:hypothetical protein
MRVPFTINTPELNLCCGGPDRTPAMWVDPV